MLYLVPTPIGNLQDITLRALRVLREVDVIACEDTRTTSKLTQHFEIDTPTVSYHSHNERKRAPQLIERMQGGEQIALVTDAGSPGISDPGFYLVRECLRVELPVEALPGATAIIPALSISGLPTDRFVFEGFLPHKKGRSRRINELVDEQRTIVLYESPYRLEKTLAQLMVAFGEDRIVSVSRELTKKFEETHRGKLIDVHRHYVDQPRIRGEIVIVVAGATT